MPATVGFCFLASESIPEACKHQRFSRLIVLSLWSIFIVSFEPLQCCQSGYNLYLINYSLQLHMQWFHESNRITCFTREKKCWIISTNEARWRLENYWGIWTISLPFSMITTQADQLFFPPANIEYLSVKEIPSFSIVFLSTRHFMSSSGTWVDGSMYIYELTHRNKSWCQKIRVISRYVDRLKKIMIRMQWCTRKIGESFNVSQSSKYRDKFSSVSK